MNTLSWMAMVILYPTKKPKKKNIYRLRVDAKDEQTARRLVLDAVHEDGKFVDQFLSVERIKK